MTAYVQMLAGLALAGHSAIGALIYPRPPADVTPTAPANFSHDFDIHWRQVIDMLSAPAEEGLSCK